MKGGNTDELYQADDKPKNGEKYSSTGTWAKSKMLVDQHPDVAEIVHRYGRIHHYVDYTKFKNNKLIRRDDFVPTGQNNEYGMKLIQAKKPEKSET